MAIYKYVKYSQVFKCSTITQALSEDISRKQAVSTVKEIEIEAARRKYLPVARNATELYFSLSSLSALHPLYQYSFFWYTQTFSKVCILIVTN
jgi:dynein heavy chain, axonemal